jgi:glycerol uptake facilitator-like aquaporin
VRQGVEEPPFDLPRRLAAEGAGTAFLVATVVGAGIMADRLTDDSALILLANAIPTGAMLMVLITVLGPVSGAHFNPAVTLAFRIGNRLRTGEAACYVAAQVAGGLTGMVAAHLMFDVAPFQIGITARSGAAQWWSEIVAAFGLVGVILSGLRFRPDAVAWLVGLYIAAAYWMTASTSFANPAVAVARAFTGTVAGIRPLDVPAFILAELLGSVLAIAAFTWLLRPDRSDQS